MRKFATIAATVLLSLTGWVGVAYATAGHGDNVTLCHATHSTSNPYVTITVDPASIVFEGHDGHDGDIIPPFAGYAGKNWTSANISIYENDCDIPETTTTTICSPTTTSTTSTTVPETTTTTQVPETTTTTIVVIPTTTTTVPVTTTSTLPPSTTTTSTVPSTTTTVPHATTTTVLPAVTTTTTTTQVPTVTTSPPVPPVLPPELAKTGNDLIIPAVLIGGLLSLTGLVLLWTARKRKD
jgi:LPXTG-motif cell wall-anchored protein